MCRRFRIGASPPTTGPSWRRSRRETTKLTGLPIHPPQLPFSVAHFPTRLVRLLVRVTLLPDRLASLRVYLAYLPARLARLPNHLPHLPSSIFHLSTRLTHFPSHLGCLPGRLERKKPHFLPIFGGFGVWPVSPARLALHLSVIHHHPHRRRSSTPRRKAAKPDSSRGDEGSRSISDF